MTTTTADVKKYKSQLQARIDFAKQHIKTKEGKPWTTEGRPWVIDEYWRAFDGWKYWPCQKSHTFDSCNTKANTLVDSETVHEKYTEAQSKTSTNSNENNKEKVFYNDAGYLIIKCDSQECAGLYLSPVIVTILNLGRRDGKTFNTAAYCLASIFQSKNESITFVAASEGQTQTLFEENYKRVLVQDEELSEECYVTGQSIRVYKTKSFFECVATAHGSITGRGRTKIILDEARDIPARTAMALIPSVFDHSGYECPYGHVRFEGQHNVKNTHKTKCRVCNTNLKPWYGRIAIMSSSGVITGTDRDWFAELVSEIEKNPHPNYHIFRSDRDDLNPDKSKKIMSAVEDVFGKLDATKAYVDIEVHNIARQKNDAFLTKAEIELCIDPDLKNKYESAWDCVAFLDTSVVLDKTSLVILSDTTTLDAGADDVAAGNKLKPWSYVTVERIDVWTPQDQPGRVIDPAVILNHLDMYMPMFPNLRSLHVDTRGMPWAVALVRDVRASRVGWGKKVHDFYGGRQERTMAWAALEQRFKSRRIKIPQHDELVKELLSVRRQKTLDAKQLEIRDKARGVRHADIAESLAECCRRAHLEILRPTMTLEKTRGAGRYTETKDFLHKRFEPVVKNLKPSSY